MNRVIAFSRSAGPSSGPATGAASAARASADAVPPSPVEHPSTGDGGPLERATHAQRERAARRLQACERSDELVQRGLRRAEADRQAGKELGASANAVGRWRAAIRDLPPGERLTRLLDAPKSGRPRGGWDDPGAAELWRHWCSDYLREEAPDAAAVHRRLKRIAHDRGWEIPGVKAFLRRTRHDFTREEIVRARQGALALLDLVPHRERTVMYLKPLDVVNGDGRRFDVLVEFPSGRIGRPVVWIWQDVRTRRVLAWAAGESESAALVRVSLHRLILQYGVPGKVLVDSTRAASAKWMTGGQKRRRRWRSDGEELPGMLQLLDIAYSVTAIDRDAAGRGKGRGRSKPVERAFGDLARHVDTHPALAGAATGRSPVDRPETHRARAAPYYGFLDVLEQVIAEHNARPGRRTELGEGERSFDDIWAEEYAGAVVRKMSAAQAGILLLSAEDPLVANDGSFRLLAGRGTGLPPNRYHHTDLLAHAGKRVIVRFDPDNLHEPAQVYDLKGRAICRADCIAKTPWHSADAGREYERSRRKLKRSTEQALAARRDMAALTRELASLPPAEAPPEPEPAAVRLVTSGRMPPPADPGAAPSHPRRRSRTMAAIVALHQEEDE